LLQDAGNELLLADDEDFVLYNFY